MVYKAENDAMSILAFAESRGSRASPALLKLFCHRPGALLARALGEGKRFDDVQPPSTDPYFPTVSSIATFRPRAQSKPRSRRSDSVMDLYKT